MQCTYCPATGTHPTRLPRGWKRSHGNPVCAKCWGERYILRAVVIPVVGPVDGTWEELRTDLRDAWADATALSNWLMTEYYVRDVRRSGQVKLPPQPKTYLYPEATVMFPSIPADGYNGHRPCHSREVPRRALQTNLDRRSLAADLPLSGARDHTIPGMSGRVR